jgi:hypothetical protein
MSIGGIKLVKIGQIGGCRFVPVSRDWYRMVIKLGSIMMLIMLWCIYIIMMVLCTSCLVLSGWTGVYFDAQDVVGYVSNNIDWCG